MKKLVDDVRLMIKVCDLYYNQDTNQQQISQIMNLSRPTVSRLLSSAREQGIVKVTIPDISMIKYSGLEEKLEKMYDLQEVLIVDSLPSEEDQKELLGRTAGRYLEYTVKSNSIVGVSMGSTLHHAASHITHPIAKNVTFVPLVGGVGQLRMELHSNSLVESFSRNYENSTFVPLHAPARVANSTIQEEFMKEESVAKAIHLADHMDLAIVGIGYPNDSSAIKATGYFKENEIDILKEKNVSGELCMQFYDEDGNTETFTKDNNVIGIDIHRLQKVSSSIGIGGGLGKLSAIRGAIRGRYINILITDYNCAVALTAEQ